MMNTQKLFKKFSALALSLIMLVASLPPVTATALSFDSSKLGDDMFLTSETAYTVAPGISELHVTTNNSTGTNQSRGFALEIDHETTSAAVVASYRNYDATSWGMQSVRDQAAAYEKATGANVVAGVNGDFYNMQTGAPTGTFVMNGVAYNKNMNWGYFAILKDGTPKIGRTATDAEIANFKEAIGGVTVLVEGGKLTSEVASETYGADQLPRTAVGIKEDKSIVLFVVDGRQAPSSHGMTFNQLALTMLSLGCESALSLDGGGSSTFLSQHEGSDDLVCRNSPSDGRERTVSTALLVVSTAKPTGEFDHAALSPNNELYTPGSSVQFSATGVDSAGANAPLPEDGIFALADSSYGTITSDGLFTSTGKTGTVTVNYMSAGQICGSVSIEIVVPDEFYVPATEVSLGFEDTTDFGITARYNSVKVNLKPGDINWAIKDLNGDDLGTTAGTFDGLTFTTLDGVTVTANVTATSAQDENVSVTLKAVIGAMPVVIYDFEGYTTNLAEAEADESLTYIPSLTMPVFDRSSSASDTQVDDFRQAGFPLYCWPNGSLNDQQSMQANIVSKDDGYPVRFGDHSLKIDYSYESYNGSSNSNNYLRVTDLNYAFEGSPTALGCWIYVPAGTSDFVLYLNCSNNAGITGGEGTKFVYQSVTPDGGINWTGWKYVEFDLTAESILPQGPFGFYQGCGVFWISYQEGNERGDRSASTLYLDNIQLIYGANTDDVNNPEIKSIRTDDAEIEDGVTVFTEDTNTIKASYGDVEAKYATGIDFEEVKMLIDGVDVTDKCYINVGDEEIYYYDLVLPDGEHSVTISVSDLFGNNTTETRFFTVDSGSETTQVTFAAVDESPILGEDYTMTIFANNPADILAADIDMSIFSNFVRYWNDYRIELNPNYTLAEDPVYDANTSTVSFKAVRNADATSANDDGTIAKIIIAIPTDVPEGLEVVYSISKGGLTYAEDKGEKFEGSFSGKTATTCSAPFGVSTDTMVTGSAGGNIYVMDTEGNPVAGAEIFTTNNESLGVTDENGALFTNRFVGSVAQFSIYAKLETKLSFIYTSQSFPSGGDASGLPSYIKLNASVDPSTTQSISWMANPLATKGEAVILYAEKAAFEANGELALTEFKGESNLIEMSSSPAITSNYAVRINNALVTGLKPGTEYVYMAGDGELMSDVKSFSTSRKGEAVNFFVIGDTQATDTTNTDEITKNLAESGVNYAFGIQTGDAVDNGGNYPMWANIAQVFSGDFLGTQDLVQVLGNHEYYGDLQGTNAAYYFGLPNTQDGVAPPYYSVQYGNVYVAVINYCAYVEDYNKAAQWLVEDAANATATWKILTMHQPSYFTNATGGNEEIRGIIAPAVDAADIDVVFSGHDHSYARTKPMTDGKVDDNGAVYYICGSTGEKSYLITPNDDFNFDTLSSDFNAIYLTVSATDTELNIQTRDYRADGTDVIVDQCVRLKNVDCSPSGHVYDYADGYLTCSVCGYVLSVAGYTGFAYDSVSGMPMYFISGTAVTGWFDIENDHYYFDENGVAQSGDIVLGGLTYVFGEDGRLTKGALVRDGSSYCYYMYTYDATTGTWSNTKQRGWHEIDGYLYYFDRQHSFRAATGVTTIDSEVGGTATYTFDSQGRLIAGAWMEDEGNISYYWGLSPVNGWRYISENQAVYYFNPSNSYMVTGEQTIGDKAYTFTADGKLTMISDSLEIDGTFYSYNAEGELLLSHIKDHAYAPAVDEAAAATCTEAGHTEGEHCSACGEIITAQETIPALGHSLGQWTTTTEATCTENGSETRACSVCDHTETREIPALGHDFEEAWTVDFAATETEPGQMSRHCTRCDEITDILVIPVEDPTGEDPSEEDPSEPEVDPVSDKLTAKEDSGITVEEDIKHVTIPEESKVNDIVKLLENESVKIVSADGVALGENDPVGTGCRIQVLDKDGNVLSEYVVIVPMDVNGDSFVNAADARLALRASARLEKLDSPYATAADADKNSRLSARDARRILRHAADLD